MSEKKKIVAITACATGIAHTYMAAKGLEDAAKELGYDIRVEKQGAGGPEDALTAEEIKEADVVILAIQKAVEEGRFAGKQICKVNADEAIKDGTAVIKKALSGEKNYVGGSSGSVETDNPTRKFAFLDHLQAGIGEMIPVVVAGGIIGALANAWGPGATDVEGSLAWVFNNIGSAALGIFMFSVFSAFVSKSIAGKVGMAAGFLGAYVATNTISAGFIGATIAGYIAGYVSKFLNEKIKVSESVKGMKNLVIVPLLSTLITCLLMVYVVGTPLTAITNMLNNWLYSLSRDTTGSLLMSIIQSLFYIDLGGSLSHTICYFAISAWSSGNYVPWGSVVTCAMVPPIGLALATFLRPKLFTDDEKQQGRTALLLGASFITEGAIPFAISHFRTALPANLVGCTVGGFLAYLFKVSIYSIHGGLWLTLIPNAVDNALGLWIATFVGALVTALLIIVLKPVLEKKKA